MMAENLICQRSEVTEPLKRDFNMFCYLNLNDVMVCTLAWNEKASGVGSFFKRKFLYRDFYGQYM